LKNYRNGILIHWNFIPGKLEGTKAAREAENQP
jgi:hypothetical protein